MNTPHLPESSAKANKLIVRSEVLAVIRHMASIDDPPKQEVLKQLKRLQDLNNLEDVLDVLSKELHRSSVGKSMQVIVEFLMELGTLELLQDRLWTIIQDTKAADEIKDGANLVLRHLGDASDPNLYLEYLDDPQGLIGRETIRMLEISAENPEALIDFIDFIMALRLEDQVRLLSALQADYPSEYLINLYAPMLEANPPAELWELLVTNMGKTRSKKAVEVLDRLAEWPEDELPVPLKLVQRSLKELQISGAANEPEPEGLHPLIQGTREYQCCATLPDGVGNQGVLFSLERPNGDVSMMSVAINDYHGIIDCFGFYQLSVGDYHRISEKFHEGATKIKVSSQYCAYKLQQALSLNYKNRFRVPYEYQCWAPLLANTKAAVPEELAKTDKWVRTEWYGETHNLYQHPDFNSWFLEQGDEPAATLILQRAASTVDDWLAEESETSEEELFEILEIQADELIGELLKTDWRGHVAQRLQDAAYLLDCQNTNTFRNLAATESYKLRNETEEDTLVSGFIQGYGRRCIGEELLRCRAEAPENERLSALVDAVLKRWEF